MKMLLNLNSLNCALKQPSLESNTNDKLPGATQTIGKWKWNEWKCASIIPWTAFFFIRLLVPVI
eukprot:scaffold5392_cov141-Skeletonema_dohrnii-CCMP3373.AAC.6